MQVQQHQLQESACCRCFSSLPCDHLHVCQARFPELLQATVLSLTKPVRAEDTSRFLHQTPWLPRVELVVGCLEHLLYVTNQLKNKHKTLTLKQQQATGWRGWCFYLVHISEHSCKALFPQWGNMQALCEGILRYILHRKVRGIGVVYSRTGSSPALPRLMSALSLTSHRTTGKPALQALVSSVKSDRWTGDFEI